jgi:hypothetical protein
MEIKLPPEGMNLRTTMLTIEYSLIDQALVMTRGNRTRAAELLGINRTALCMKISSRSTRVGSFRAANRPKLPDAEPVTTEELERLRNTYGEKPDHIVARLLATLERKESANGGLESGLPQANGSEALRRDLRAEGP